MERYYYIPEIVVSDLPGAQYQSNGVNLFE